MKVSKNCYLIMANVNMSIAIISIFLLYFLLGHVAIVALIFFILSVGQYLYIQAIRRTDLSLKEYGISYEADILQLTPTRHFQVKGCLSFYTECRYQDDQGKVHFVKSRLLFLRRRGYAPGIFFPSAIKPFADLVAVVYVDPNNANNYYIEIGTQT